MAQNKGFKGLLKSIFGKDDELELETREPYLEKLDTIPDKLPEEPMKWEESGILPPLEDSLLKLWNKWAEEDEIRPSLSLTETLDEERVQMDAEQLEAEAKRANMQLQQAAKQRLQQIDAMEKKGNESLDAQCCVYISRDKMLAWLILFPPVGETGTLRVDEIGKAMQSCQVSSGIESDAIVRIIQNKPYFELIPIAIGTPPVEGTNGTIKEYYEKTPPFEVKIDDNGVADYRASNYVYQIMQGDVICDITYAVPGKAGLRIDGSIAEPKKVKDVKIPKGENTEVTEDGLHLIAAIDGNLEYKNGVFQICPVLVIPGDVDYEVGNLNFNGDIHVKGDVRENFVVRATGSIMIDGLVEAATIDAGTDLIITRGVGGDNRALIRSKGSVRAKYLENCVVYAKGSVYADCIMNSQVFSDNSIHVCSGRGSVIGGALTAAEQIQAKMIGAQSGRRTEITLGVFSLQKEELQDIEQDMEVNRAEIKELDEQLRLLEKEQGLEGSDARLAKLRMRQSVLEMKAEQLCKRHEKVETMVPELTKCRLECDTIYPITTITVHNATWTARDIRMNCRISYDTQKEMLQGIR